MYHAGLKDAERIQAQENFMSGRKQMIVATNAFGMGIDKPDIRFVVHYQMPGSIEAYYQEIGRAGRDGLPSTCLLLFNYADKNTHDFFIDGSYPSMSVVREVYDALVSTGRKQIELSATEIARRTDEKNEMAINSALYLLERAGHIERTVLSPNQSAEIKRHRTIVLLDDPPVTQLRVNFPDVGRRGDLERRKLREMIEFCYTENCFRGYILDYFGDRKHERHCGTCGNCGHSSLTGTSQTSIQIDSAPRDLSDDELLRVRKILACARRMKGQFGKQLLAATLRGSASRQVLRARLNELSTYGLLNDMQNDEIMLFIEALISARCLSISGGQYPTVSVTDFGNAVMLEKDKVLLSLPEGKSLSDESDLDLSRRPTQTMLASYGLYRKKLNVREIAKQRGLARNTVEEHLQKCLAAGLELDVCDFVSLHDKVIIDAALDQHGTGSLKALRDRLPQTITYAMIRFVIADRQRLKTKVSSASVGS
jgi:ATP-dependent DNA helicase RecQ